MQDSLKFTSVISDYTDKYVDIFPVASIILDCEYPLHEQLLLPFIKKNTVNNVF